MDNATHAFAGLLMADATARWIEQRTGVTADRSLRRTVVALGLVAAELPDADLLYSGRAVGLGPLGYLLHHRGHTHTVVFALAAALLMWWLVVALRRRSAGPSEATARERERMPLLALAVAATLSHLLLDYTNSYGVHPFWPIDNRWYYGDSVFIVEPWLWVVAIPPLLFGPRRVWSRVLLSLLLVIIVGAAWRLGEMTPPLALAVTVGAVVWLAVQRWIPASRRVVTAIGVWGLVEAVFFVSSSQAKATLRRELPTDERTADIVATPGAGNPFCFAAFVVSTTATEYRVRTAMVAPWPAAQRASEPPEHACRARIGRTRLRALQGVESVQLRSTDAVTWGEQWSAPLAEARSLSATRCEFAHALRFMRVPVWRTESNGVVQLSDARFGIGSSGFSDLAIADGECPFPNAWIPPWRPPRAELLN